MVELLPNFRDSGFLLQQMLSVGIGIYAPLIIYTFNAFK
jgi:hypothetical protein